MSTFQKMFGKKASTVGAMAGGAYGAYVGAKTGIVTTTLVPKFWGAWYVTVKTVTPASIGMILNSALIYAGFGFGIGYGVDLILSGLEHLLDWISNRFSKGELGSDEADEYLEKIQKIINNLGKNLSVKFSTKFDELISTMNIVQERIVPETTVTETTVSE